MVVRKRRARGMRAGAGPRPGLPVRGSRSGRPIMALLDVLGRRWALRVIWELRGGGLSFRALQERCNGVSPSVLNARLAELREAGVLAAREGEGYGLTRDGAALLAALAPLDAWAKGWAARLLTPCRRRNAAHRRPRPSRREK